MDAVNPTNDTAPDGDASGQAGEKMRNLSFSQHSDTSQTAAEFIRDQLQLEADAREALPYSIENCTKPLGPLRQSVFACLTCNPPPANPSDSYNGAGVCYSCSVQCHGEHTLVEIFNKRNFTCDCGTTRLPATSPCTLRINPATNTKGDVHSEEPDPNNKYNQNFRNRFCGCGLDYDPFKQKGTMFQCLGLGTHEVGGCGEDWWHPGCIVGLGPKWFEKAESKQKPAQKTEPAEQANGTLAPISEAEEAPAGPDAPGSAEEPGAEDDDPPPPPGFPADEDFDGFICYKCTEAFPWIRRYAGAPGFLPPVFLREDEVPADEQGSTKTLKRKAAEDDADDTAQAAKRPKAAGSDTINDSRLEAPATEEAISLGAVAPSDCKLDALPPAPEGRFSLFFTDSFREKLCRCSSCFPLLQPHPQLLDEEETYEPPVSDEGSENGASSHGSGSLLDRGESALRNVDRVRAIEGVMAYNHLKDKLKPFFQQFAESGQAISAEDIKEYFAKLRGDDQAIKDAGDAAAKSDFRQEQDGY